MSDLERQFARDHQKCRDRIVAQFNDPKRLKALSLPERIHLAELAGRDCDRDLVEYPLPRETLNILAQELREQQSTGSVPFETLRDMVLAFRHAMMPNEAQEWGRKAYTQVFLDKTPDATVLRNLAVLMTQVWLAPRKDCHYPEFLQNLRRVADQDNFWLKPGDRDLFAKVLTADREELRRLIDVQTPPAVELANILTAIYRDTEELPAWISVLDKKISETANDEKACWLLVRGCAEVDRITPHLDARRLPWIQQAEQTARSETTRLEVLRQYAGFHCEVRQVGEALKLVRSSAERFSGPNRMFVTGLTRDLEDVAKVQGIASRSAIGRKT